MDALSQSYLKKVIKVPGLPKTRYYEEDATLMGKLVDCLITSPDSYADEFFVSSFKKPGVGSLSIIKRCFDTTPDKDSLEKNKLRVIAAARIENFGGSWDDERIYKALLKEGAEPWWEELKKSNGRTIISEEEYSTAMAAVSKVKKHPYSSWIFEYPRIKYQVPLTWTYRGHFCKALLDMILYNDTDEEDVLPPQSVVVIDLKYTSESVKKFNNAMHRYGYDKQMAWYRLAVEKTNTKGIKNFGCALLAVNSSNEPPLIYSMSDKDLEIGQYGAYKVGGEWVPLPDDVKFDPQKHIPGFEQLIDFYEYQELHNAYDTEPWIHASNGILNSAMW